MRHVARWAWRVFVLLSSLACAGSVGMWVRGHYIIDWASRRDGRAQFVGAAGGFVYTTGPSTFEPRSPGQLPPVGWQVEHSRPPMDAMEFFMALYDNRLPVTGLGFGWDVWRDGGHVTGWRVVVPWWAVVVATAVAPGVALWRAWRRRWRATRWAREGRCAGCGYDLRATPGRCPECGAAII